MNQVELKDLQVGKTYYIHQVMDENTHEPVSLKYKAVCTANYSFSNWYDFGFNSVQGINTQDIVGELGISLDEWVIYRFYLCQRDEINERVTINAALRDITGDHSFKFY